MANQELDPKRVTSDRLLDLLLDALLQRQAERRERPSGPAVVEHRVPTPEAPREGARRPMRGPPKEGLEKSKPPKTGPGDEGWEPPPKVPPIQLERVLVRFLALVAVLIVAVNVPVNQYGVSLARILPDSASLVIREGLVLKGSGPEIYVLQQDHLRWVSSMDAFEHLGLKWGDVHVVDDAFLRGFEQGPPIHVLLKCQGSPHVYRLENQQKRWIKDIDTFLAEGHVWDDVRFVSCEYLRQLADGPPIPEDAGPPPQP